MTLLEVTDLRASYGQAEVLHGISLTVGQGEVVVMLVVQSRFRDLELLRRGL
jgi:ABC-type branched-subunit amino acid transport system ATPase component